MRHTRRRRASRRSCAVGPWAVSRGLSAMSWCQDRTNLASREASARWQAALAECAALGEEEAVEEGKAGAGGVAVELGGVVEAVEAEAAVAERVAGAGSPACWAGFSEVGRGAGGSASLIRRCTYEPSWAVVERQKLLAARVTMPATAAVCS